MRYLIGIIISTMAWIGTVILFWSDINSSTDILVNVMIWGALGFFLSIWVLVGAFLIVSYLEKKNKSK